MSSIWRRTAGGKAIPSSLVKTGIAQKRAPRMKPTVTFDDRSEATRPIAIIRTPISQ